MKLLRILLLMPALLRAVNWDEPLVKCLVKDYELFIDEKSCGKLRRDGEHYVVTINLPEFEGFELFMNNGFLYRLGRAGTKILAVAQLPSNSRSVLPKSFELFFINKLNDETASLYLANLGQIKSGEKYFETSDIYNRIEAFLAVSYDLFYEPIETGCPGFLNKNVPIVNLNKNVMERVLAQAASILDESQMAFVKSELAKKVAYYKIAEHFLNNDEGVRGYYLLFVGEYYGTVVIQTICERLIQCRINEDFPLNQANKMDTRRKYLWPLRILVRQIRDYVSNNNMVMKNVLKEAKQDKFLNLDNIQQLNLEILEEFLKKKIAESKVEVTADMMRIWIGEEVRSASRENSRRTSSAASSATATGERAGANRSSRTGTPATNTPRAGITTTRTAQAATNGATETAVSPAISGSSQSGTSSNGGNMESGGTLQERIERNARRLEKYARIQEELERRKEQERQEGSIMVGTTGGGSGAASATAVAATVSASALNGADISSFSTVSSSSTPRSQTQIVDGEYIIISDNSNKNCLIS